MQETGWNEKKEEKKEVQKTDKTPLGYKIGQCVAALLVLCLATCVVGTAVALTAKYLLWLF